MAGFPNGEATRANTIRPHFYFARYFFRQTLGFGGGTLEVRDDKNEVAGVIDKNRLVFTCGKMAAGDLFDGNSFSHDPRSQFLNWALMENGAWDYPADARGYTHGAVLEYISPTWSARIGTFMEPKNANSLELDDNIARAHGEALEIEKGYLLAGRPGVLRVLGYINTARMGHYREALDQPGGALDLTATERYGTKKYGFGINIEQEISPDVGVFSRVGWSDGHTETWAFTEIDRTATIGFSVKGSGWHRPQDVFGIAGIINGLSRDHRDFLAAGGIGFIIGDGRLRYAPEEIMETYYMVQLTSLGQISLNYQLVANPAYNADRGPVSIGAIRLHLDL